MAMSARNRRKSVATVQKLVPEAQIIGYAIGRSGSNPAIVVGAMIGTVAAVSIALLAATGGFVVPGVLPMLVVQHFLSPPRGVAVAQQGVVLTKRSLWTGRPSGVIATIGHGYVQPTEVSLGRVKVMVGNEGVWLPAKEEALLRGAFHHAPLVHG